MTWLRRILPILFLLCLPSLAHANPRYNGFCMKGGQTVLTSNLPGTPQVMASYPQCTVNVFLTGTTTLATLFSDNFGTPLPNPLSSDQFGYFFFYVASGTRVDIQLSGTGISTYTIGDVVLLDSFILSASIPLQLSGTTLSILGCNTVTCAFDSLAPAPSVQTGNILYHNGVHWVTLNGQPVAIPYFFTMNAGVPSWLSTAQLSLTQTIASGTSTLTTSPISSGICGVTVTSAAVGVAATDSIIWSYTLPFSPSNDGRLILNPFPTTGNVNFSLCNPTTGSITPSGVVVNWRVVR